MKENRTWDRVRFFYVFFDCIFCILVNESVSWIAWKRLNEYNLFIFRNGKFMAGKHTNSERIRLLQVFCTTGWIQHGLAAESWLLKMKSRILKAKSWLLEMERQVLSIKKWLSKKYMSYAKSRITTDLLWRLF